MPYTNSEIRFEGTVSDNVTTSGANEEIIMQNGASVAVTVGALSIHCVDAMTIKVNDEDNIHTFSAGDKFSFDGTPITKITVIESGVNIIYSGGYVA